MFALLRNFSTTKFYEAAQAGALTGAAPFTAGVLFRTGLVIPANTEYLFGNAPEAATTGLSFRQLITTGQFQAQQGTTIQNSGPVDTAQAVMADATADASAQALANSYKSTALGSQPVTTDDVRTFDTPKPSHMVFAVMVVDGANQLLYINGQLVKSLGRSTTLSAEAFRIGLAPDATNMPCVTTDIAGCFYHSAALTTPNVAFLQAAAVAAQDVPTTLSGFGVPSSPTLDYVWSVKTGNPDCRASWVSRGGATTPITMTRNGTWVPANTSVAQADVYAADYPWL